MFNDKGFITFKDGDFKTTINYMKKDGYLFGITLKTANKIGYFKEHQVLPAGEGVKPEEFTDVKVEVLNQEKGKEIYDQLSEMKFNHFKEYDSDIVGLKIEEM